MFVSKKSPLKISKHNKVDPECPAPSRPNPFDSDDEFDTKKTLKPSRKTSSQPNLTAPYFSTNPFDGDEERGLSASSKYFHASAARHEYNNDFRDFVGLDNQSVQELENYAVYKAKEATRSVNGCLKIAEDMREGAARNLITLHQQGQQITKTHDVAVEIDHDLSRSEKLLGSLGGIFSKTWKPKKNRPIMGPIITRGSSWATIIDFECKTECFVANHLTTMHNTSLTWIFFCWIKDFSSVFHSACFPWSCWFSTTM